MEKALYIIFLCSFSWLCAISQDKGTIGIQPLTKAEQFELSSLPELRLPDSYREKELPYEVDNTTQSCYSGLFHQSGLSCGQAAMVGNCFTYEINSLRNLNGQIVANKYPTHFSWNWENGGYGWYGVSYYHSFSVLKQVGSPNMEIYGGGHDSGGETRFMSGYDAYYEGMQNRLEDAYAINCSTEEGILTLKHWINDHLDSSEVGGIGAFYSEHQNPSTVLPAGTEHAGEKVVISWGASPSHAMTITGYNDSIRWDYNNDGLYTNDIDINGDGIINVRDWEIGGFKMCNTYGNIYNGWMMYKSLAMPPSYGGIWSNTVNVIRPIKEYSPLWTIKTTIYHTYRRLIKVLAGISDDLTDNEPEYYLTFPIFNNQGADLGMQGANDEASREAEIGFDITPLASLYPSGTPLKFFLLVSECDEEDLGYGMIKSFSVIDYSGSSPLETVCNQNNVEIENNATTTISLTYTPTHESPEITTAELPNAAIYNDYSYQLSAAEGTPPYRWQFDTDYTVEEYNSTFPAAATPLSESIVELPFEFPFFGSKYSSFNFNAKGLIDFSGESYSLPYNNNTHNNCQVTFMSRKCIAAYFSDLTFSSKYYEAGSDYFIVRWVSDAIDVSVKLESNGNIIIYYSSCNPINSNSWVSGVSYGDVSHLYPTPLSGSGDVFSNTGYILSPITLSSETVFQLSSGGLLTGYVSEEIFLRPLNIKVTDKHGLSAKKTLYISSEGLLMSAVANTPNNDIIEWGEEVTLDLLLNNATDTPITNLIVTISCDNPDITIVDSTCEVAQLSPHEIITVPAAFEFSTGNNFYNGESINFLVTATAEVTQWNTTLTFPVYTADISITEHYVDDGGNNRLDIGETSDVLFKIDNFGGAELRNASISVESNDWFITINDGNDNIDLILADSSANARFNFTAADDCIPGHAVILNFHITADNDYEKDITAYISIGQIIENWESGTFDTYNWSHSGDMPWTICDESPYEGEFCIRSGEISDSQESVITVELQVLSPGAISFYRKVSCEEAANDNYDYLLFKIDALEKARWDGEQDWEQVSFDVPAGIHSFSWIYHKDYSVSSFQDCAWIDLIEFPSIYDADPLLHISKQEVIKYLYENETGSDTILISNHGGGIIKYEATVLDNCPWMDSCKPCKVGREISGSYMEVAAPPFYYGDTVAWTFSATSISGDNEWIKGIAITFPEGIYVDSVSYMIDSGNNDTIPLVEGQAGNGGRWRWFGENANGWGLLSSNEVAFCTVFGHILEPYGDMIIPYTLEGDIYGEEPHTVNDSLVIKNYGRHIQWLSLESFEGSLGIGYEQEITLLFDSHELLAGNTYECQIVITTDIDTTLSVPVSLIIQGPFSIDNKISEVKIYPNPSSGSFFIVSEHLINTVTIVNSNGKFLYRTIVSDYSAEIAKDLPSGVYFIVINAEGGSSVKKLVITH